MKKAILASLLCFGMLSGCSSDDQAAGTVSSAPMATIASSSTSEAPDPLVELLKDSPTSADYILEKSVFLEKSKEEGAVLIDLRTAEELKKLPKLPEALEIDIFSGTAGPDYFRAADKTKTYFLYDSNGSRSQNVYNSLKKLEFPNVYILKSGIGDAK